PRRPAEGLPRRRHGDRLERLRRQDRRQAHVLRGRRVRVGGAALEAAPVRPAGQGAEPAGDPDAGDLAGEQAPARRGREVRRPGRDLTVECRDLAGVRPPRGDDRGRFPARQRDARRVAGVAGSRPVARRGARLDVRAFGRGTYRSARALTWARSPATLLIAAAPSFSGHGGGTWRLT